MPDGSGGIAEQEDVVKNTDQQRDAESGMEQSGVRRGLLLQHFDATFTDPTPHLSSDERGKHDHKGGAEFVPEYGHGKAGFGDGEPAPFVELFDFGRSQGAEAEALEAIHKRSIDNKHQICENLNGLLSDEPQGV